MKEREKFGSRLGFILVSAGCAIGLGNVWKFPYMCGQHGGALFILIYLVFLVVLGFPILISEFAVGRGSGRGMAKAYEALEPANTKWHHFKWISILGSYLLMMFYTMVGGWMLFYSYKMISGQLKNMDTTEVTDSFTDMIGSASTMAGWMIAAVAVSFLVCVLGLRNGVEKISKIMMTLLIVIMVVLAVHSVLIEGAGEGIEFYLIPDFDAFSGNEIGTTIFAAMTHSFFTLSIGIGSMEIFGSYMEKDRSISGEAVNIIVLDTMVALIAGFIIIPACFAYGIEPDSGPSLLFITLPNVFNNMSNGLIWGSLFFICMAFAALSTIIAVFENIIAFFMDSLEWSRKKAVLINLIGIIVLSLPAILGFNLLVGIQPLGDGTNIMDLEDFIVSYNLLPIGSIVFVMFAVKKNGWGWSDFIKEVNTGKGLKLTGSKVLQFYMTWILPAIIVVVYFKGYYDFFSPNGTEMLIKWMIFAVVLLAVTIVLMTYKKKERY